MAGRDWPRLHAGGARPLVPDGGRPAWIRAAASPPGIAAAVCGITWYTRDPFGRLTEIIEPNGAGIELTWTPEGYLARRVVPHGGSERFGYDATGRWCWPLPSWLRNSCHDMI